MIAQTLLCCVEVALLGQGSGQAVALLCTQRFLWPEAGLQQGGLSPWPAFPPAGQMQTAFLTTVLAVPVHSGCQGSGMGRKALQKQLVLGPAAAAEVIERIRAGWCQWVMPEQRFKAGVGLLLQVQLPCRQGLGFEQHRHQELLFVCWIPGLSLQQPVAPGGAGLWLGRQDQPGQTATLRVWIKACTAAQQGGTAGALQGGAPLQHQLLQSRSGSGGGQRDGRDGKHASVRLSHQRPPVPHRHCMEARMTRGIASL